jgi:hypothetical protein
VVLEALLDLQLPLLAALLVAAGSAKLAGIAGGAGSPSSAASPGGAGTRLPDRPLGPCALLPPRVGRVATVALAAAEIALGIGLFVTANPIFRAATIVAFGTSLWVINELRTRRPGVGCGCFGRLSSAPADGRTMLRAWILTAAAVAAAEVPVSGLEVLGGLSTSHFAGLAAIAAEIIAIGLVSPEIGTVINRLRRRLPCELRTKPLVETYQRLLASPAWHTYAPVLTAAEPLDVWRELCWRYLVYPGRIDGRPVDVVFAVYLDGRRPPVRAAIVEPEPAAPAERYTPAEPSARPGRDRAAQRSSASTSV